ncbi:response regulator transcription factor [Streptomyces sp. 5.8]|uniref:response regulator transcription factor n=1 Tax=Streptomyces sp. 5.8 TaxID=3406571 RepID=UPI003BB75CEF
MTFPVAEDVDYLTPLCTFCQLDERDQFDKETEWIRQGLPRIFDLSDRELQVFHLLAWGPSNDELAERVETAVRTVKFHLENIRGKLGGLSRTQTCILAVHHRIATCSTGHGCGVTHGTEGPLT